MGHGAACYPRALAAGHARRSQDGNGSRARGTAGTHGARRVLGPHRLRHGLQVPLRPCTHTHTHTLTHTHTCIQDSYMHIFICVSVCVCMCTYIYALGNYKLTKTTLYCTRAEKQHGSQHAAPHPPAGGTHTHTRANWRISSPTARVFSKSTLYCDFYIALY